MRFGWLIALLGLGLVLNGFAWAGEHGKGKGKDKEKTGQENAAKEKGTKDQPPGWDKGKKKGWDDEYPPGWDKKSDKEKTKWKADVEEAKETVGREADNKGVNAEEKSRLREAVERMCRKGKEAKEATGVVVDELKKGKNAMEILKDNGIVIEVGG